jgi:predicted nucleic acid-binding protein
MSFVLDCSVAMGWCFEDEAAARTDALLERVRDDGAVVPYIWHLEVANVLLAGERRGRIVDGRAESFLETLAALGIETDDLAAPDAIRSTYRLGKQLGLTAYDAFYLELALRRRLPLASSDARLNEAARAVRVPLIPD